MSFQKTEIYVLNIAENTVVSSFSCKMIVNLRRLYYNDYLRNTKHILRPVDRKSIGGILWSVFFWWCWTVWGLEKCRTLHSMATREADVYKRQIRSTKKRRLPALAATWLRRDPRRKTSALKYAPNAIRSLLVSRSWSIRAVVLICSKSVMACRTKNNSGFFLMNWAAQSDFASPSAFSESIGGALWQSIKPVSYTHLGGTYQNYG